MILKLSWRNIWRNKFRSFLLGLTIAMGLAGALFLIAAMNGMIADRNKRILETQLGHIQIHNPKFIDFKNSKYTISDYRQISIFLDTSQFVKYYSDRLKIFAVAIKGNSVAGIIINGINPDKDKNVSKIWKYFVDTASLYLDQAVRSNAVIIGEPLAQALQLGRYTISDENLKNMADWGLGVEIIDSLKKIKGIAYRNQGLFLDTLEFLIGEENFDKYSDFILSQTVTYKMNKKIILRFTSANGELISEGFRICGIYDTQNDNFDKYNIFVKKDILSDLAGFEDASVNEIALILNDFDKADEFKKILKENFPEEDIKTAYDIDYYLQINKAFGTVMYMIFEFFVLFGLTFGILNTMLMAVLERKKELAMLLAVGMQKNKVFWTVILESVILSVLGGIVGVVVGYFFIVLISKNGIDLTLFFSQGLEALGMSSVLKPELPSNSLLYTGVFVVLLGILSSVYPAYKAIKTKSVEALKSDT